MIAAQQDLHVVQPKIIVPRLSQSVVSRDRLIERFEVLLDGKLILITAPAGYGKTTLLIEAAQQIDIPTCWYSLDRLDRDPNRFVKHFTASIAKRFPGFGGHINAFLDNNQPLDTRKVDLLITLMINEAYKQIPEDFMLVLDDYHLVTGQPVIDYFIDQFVQLSAENCHLVIASRQLVTLRSLALLVGRMDASGIGMDELAFQTDETRQLFQKKYQLPLPEKRAAALVQQTKGWVTGLLLAVQTMSEALPKHQKLPPATGIDLYDYLAQQVLAQQAAPLRDVLLRTALLEEFDAPLCQAVLGSVGDDGSKWPALLQSILDSRLFVEVLAERDGLWLRYHDLFRDFLQGQMEATYPAESQAILVRLAEHYTDQGHYEQAYTIYDRLADQPAIANLLERSRFQIIRDGNYSLLNGWLEALADSILGTRPLLLALKGRVTSHLGETEQGLSYFEQAERLCRKNNDFDNLAWMLAQRASIYSTRGRYQAALQDAEEALTLVGEDETLLFFKIGALRAQGQSLYRLGALDQARACFERASKLLSPVDDPHSAAVTYADLGMIYSRLGQFQQAIDCAQQGISYLRESGNLASLGNALNNLGVHYHYLGAYDQAGSALEKALTYARQTGDTQTQAFSLTSIGDFYVDLDALETAQRVYAEAKVIAQRLKQHFLRVYIGVAQAALARQHGDLDRAQGLLKESQSLAAKGQSDHLRGICQLETGQQALGQNRDAEALPCLTEAVALLAQSGERREYITACLCLGQAYQRLGDTQAAIHQVQQAFQVAEHLDTHHLLMMAGRQVSDLLSAFQSAPDIGPRIKTLRRDIAQLEQGLPDQRRRLRHTTSIVAAIPPQLRIQAFGEPMVILNEEPLTNPEWKTQRTVRELFFYLLAHPAGLSKERIGLDFWPDSDSRQLQRQFKNAVYRLRRATLKDIVLHQDEVYTFNWQLDYLYDVADFERNIVDADRTETPAEQVALYQTALSHYQGQYLAEFESDWIWPIRTRLERHHRMAYGRIIAFFLETDQWAAGTTYCEQFLTLYPDDERGHRLAMQLYAAQGDRLSVIRQFARCEQVLRETLGVAVSSETRALYERLIQ